MYGGQLHSLRDAFSGSCWKTVLSRGRLRQRATLKREHPGAYHEERDSSAYFRNHSCGRCISCLVGSSTSKFITGVSVRCLHFSRDRMLCNRSGLIMVETQVRSIEDRSHWDERAHYRPNGEHVKGRQRLSCTERMKG